MCKTGSADLASIGPFATVADEEDAHFALGSFDGGVRLSRGNGVSFGVQKEVVDQGLHVLLHGRAWWRHDLVVFDTYGAGRHLVQTLMDDSQTLSEFLHSAQVPVIAVAVDADWYVKLHLVVSIVRLALAHVPRHAAAPKHDARERVVKRICGGNDTDALCSAFPDPVVRQQLLCLVDSVAELCGPLIDVVEKSKR